jgi:hypothetical protein
VDGARVAELTGSDDGSDRDCFAADDAEATDCSCWEAGGPDGVSGAWDAETSFEAAGSEADSGTCGSGAALDELRAGVLLPAGGVAEGRVVEGAGAGCDAAATTWGPDVGDGVSARALVANMRTNTTPQSAKALHLGEAAR